MRYGISTAPPADPPTHNVTLHSQRSYDGDPVTNAFRSQLIMLSWLMGEGDED
jgi:hypothetical protein